MDRQELGAFLRSRRERVLPVDVGLPSGPRRRTAGLRREEVAALAHISTEYYVRLEQARAPRPSGDVLAAIARALRLSDTESDHLHLLAGTARTQPRSHPRELRASMLALLGRLPGTAAIVHSAIFEVLAWNPLAAALMEDFGAVPPHERNLARKAFLAEGDPHALYGISDDDDFRRGVVLELRAARARYPADPAVTGLVEELRDESPGFRRLWESHDVQPAPMLEKTFRHPRVGPITLDCDALRVPDRDQHVVLFTAVAGSAGAEALEMLELLELPDPDALVSPGGTAGAG